MLALAPDVALSVSPADPARWRRLVAGMRSDRWWLGYRDSEVIAHRLHRRLRDRRRLSFDEERIPFVAAVLARTRPSVDFAADGVMQAVTAAVAQAGPA